MNVKISNNRKISQIIIGVSLIIIILAICYLMISVVIQKSQIELDAKVIEIIEDNNDEEDHMIVYYTYNNIDYSDTVKIRFPWIKKGDNVSICITETTPENARLKGYYYFIFIVVMFVPIVLLIVSFVSLIVDKKHRKMVEYLKNYGKVTTAKITGMKCINNKDKRMHSIEMTVNDEFSNFKHTFKQNSVCVTEIPVDYTMYQVRIYYDSDDLKKFFVDWESLKKIFID